MTNQPFAAQIVLVRDWHIERLSADCAAAPISARRAAQDTIAVVRTAADCSPHVSLTMGETTTGNGTDFNMTLNCGLGLVVGLGLVAWGCPPPSRVGGEGGLHHATYHNESTVLLGERYAF